MTTKKAIVLTSGGIDSATCLAIAVDTLGAENVISARVTYGQKHSKELDSAKKLAEYYGVPQYTLDLSNILQYSNCPLMANSTKELKHESYAEQIAKDGEGIVESYVPFRNGLMLSSVAALAMSLFPEGHEVEIYLGAHADDAAGSAYADCSPEFSEAMASAINIGTYNKVKVVAPLINMNKSQVVATGLKLNVPYGLTWSCYEGREKACGTCGTCIDRRQAFIDNGTTDPIEYEQGE